MLKAKKLVLAGDPMQLGPTIISEGNLRHQKNKDSKPKSAASSNQVAATDESETSNNTDVDSDDVVTGEEAAVEKVPENDNGQKKKKKKTTCVLRPPRSLNKTLFDRVEDMYGSKVKLMLDVQYRLVCDIPSIDLHCGPAQHFVLG